MVLLLQVNYAGVCYSEGHVRKSHFRPSLPGKGTTPIHQGVDTSNHLCTPVSLLPSPLSSDPKLTPKLV